MILSNNQGTKQITLHNSTHTYWKCANRLTCRSAPYLKEYSVTINKDSYTYCHISTFHKFRVFFPTFQMLVTFVHVKTDLPVSFETNTA